MASNIDITKPTAGTATTASVRLNFSYAKTEIEALQTDKATTAALTAHTGNTSNPHSVTAAQVGAAELTAGTECIQNPYVVSTDTSVAHGLGQIPHFVRARLECKTAEFNYAVGDTVHLPDNPTDGGGMGGGNIGLSWGYNATNLWVTTSAGRVAICNKTTGVLAQITASRWKIVLTPYKLS